MDTLGDRIQITYPTPLTETYARSWRERLFSWPWHPMTKIGTRETTYSLIRKRMIEAEAAMKRAMDMNVYSALESKDGR